MLNEVIIKLLKDNSRVIIPELEAIIVQPDNKTLTFNEFLKFNDGMLIDACAKTNGIEKAEASKVVKKFINEIIKALAKNNEYKLDDLGKLHIDENEKIQFSIFEEAEFVSKRDFAENKPINIETPNISQPYNLPNSSLLPDNLAETHTANPKENTTMFENDPISKPEDGHSALNDFDYYEKKPVWKTALIVILIIALVSVAGFYMYKKSNLFSGKKEITKVENAPVKAEPTVASTENNSAPENTSVAESNVKNKYHIIAGAFTVEKNAESFIKELQKKGYEPQVVLKRNAYSFISIFSYPTFKEANSKFKTFEGTGMPVWIMKY